MGTPFMRPRQVVLVTSSYRGKSNICASECAMFLDSEPPFVSLALPSNSFTLEIIARSGEFVVAEVGENLAEAARLAWDFSGKVIDKFVEGRIETASAAVVDAPLVKDAIANAECRVLSMQNFGSKTLLCGEIVRIAENEKMKGKKVLFCDSGGGFFGMKKGGEGSGET